MQSPVTRKVALRMAWVLLGLAAGLWACTASPTALPTPTPLRVGTLIPYRTPTPTPTPLLLPSLPAPTETPAPTATPFTYTVKQGDTMLAIAFNYGLSLDQLLAANPTVQPRLLSVGTLLVIPIEGEIATAAPTAAPLPLQAVEPVCYSQADGGLWCFMQVVNDQAQAVENLSGRISLFSISGESLGSQPAYAPLNILRPGERLPLVAYFSPPVVGELIAQGELLSALAVAEGDPRYLVAGFQANTLTTSTDGMSARVSGVVLLPEGEPAAGSLWLAGVAYDVTGKIVGVRKWQVEVPCSAAAQEAGTPAPESGCNRLPFEGTIYSLGSTIDTVEILVEARP